MIKEIHINNFKSIKDLTIELSRFNILVGANGSGKSNILEAITFGGAACADKLDNEFLGSRGIRPSSAKLMRSAFKNNHEEIKVVFKNEYKRFSFTISENDGPILRWHVKEKNELQNEIIGALKKIISGENTNE